VKFYEVYDMGIVSLFVVIVIFRSYENSLLLIIFINPVDALKLRMDDDDVAGKAVPFV
jgi:hypothetical protein